MKPRQARRQWFMMQSFSAVMRKLPKSFHLSGARHNNQEGVLD